MQLAKLDPNGNPWVEGVLHALGASTVAFPEAGGPVVEPDIDLSNYLIEVESYVPPLSCTKRQFLLALLDIGKHETDALASLADAPEAMIEWQYPDAGVFKRQHAMFAELAKDFNLTTRQMNDLFVAAGAK